MTATSNAALARTMVEAFGRGDLETVGASFADDAVWDLPGTSAVAGTYTGPDAIIGFLAKSYELSGGTLTLELIDILGSEWGAVQVQRVRAERDGRTLDCVETLAHQIRDGKIVRTYHRPDQYAIDAFFG
ncbi:MAG: nuclear transport factor 2 family protein [Nocardiaceae bacterium]|nr:nuclear transport factor 2 family protein [Nocardiaceae bacterium]